MSENVARMKQMDPNASAGKPGELLITLMSPSEAQIKAVNDWMNSKKAVLIHEHKFPPSKILHVKVDEDLASKCPVLIRNFMHFMHEMHLCMKFLR